MEDESPEIHAVWSSDWLHPSTSGVSGGRYLARIVSYFGGGLVVGGVATFLRRSVQERRSQEVPRGVSFQPSKKYIEKSPLTFLSSVFFVVFSTFTAMTP